MEQAIAKADHHSRTRQGLHRVHLTNRILQATATPIKMSVQAIATVERRHVSRSRADDEEVQLHPSARNWFRKSGYSLAKSNVPEELEKAWGFIRSSNTGGKELCDREGGTDRQATC